MLRFENDEATLELTVASYELSDTYQADSDEKNWLSIRAMYREDDLLIKDSNSCLLTYELKDLAVGLKVLAAGIKDRYDSDFSEPFFLLQAWKEGDGFLMDVSFALPNTMAEVDVAELRIAMTLAEMKSFISQIEKDIERFPER
ncbi:hypothetical protein RFF05_02530 [Bengtsoniella intestinalis]|uniref:WapI family immunity protein n=1 Tax=Bengtsoniella intestinalis TaxID=3073143 RepID=UPI00391EE9B4